MDLKELTKITDPILKSQVLSVLYTRISSGLELGELQKNDLPKPDDFADTWEWTNEYLEDVATNQKEGIKLGLALIGIPHSADKLQEQTNQWMKTSGLMLLGFDQIKGELIGFLENDPDSKKLSTLLKGLMDIDISDLTNSGDFINPKGYSTVQAVFICLGLKDGKNIASQNLYESALKRASDPDIKSAYGFLIPDCTYLKTRFEND